MSIIQRQWEKYNWPLQSSFSSAISAWKSNSSLPRSQCALRCCYLGVLVDYYPCLPYTIYTPYHSFTCSNLCFCWISCSTESAVFHCWMQKIQNILFCGSHSFPFSFSLKIVKWFYCLHLVSKYAWILTASCWSFELPFTRRLRLEGSPSHWLRNELLP